MQKKLHEAKIGANFYWFFTQSFSANRFSLCANLWVKWKFDFSLLYKLIFPLVIQIIFLAYLLNDSSKLISTLSSTSPIFEAPSLMSAIHTGFSGVNPQCLIKCNIVVYISEKNCVKLRSFVLFY